MGTQGPYRSHSLLDVTPARTILVYRNGDQFYVGKKFVINRRRVSSLESLMTQLNEKVAVPFGVRRLYTPYNGHLVRELEELQQGGRFVAAGREKFRKLDYFHIAPQKPTRMKKVKEGRDEDKWQLESTVCLWESTTITDSAQIRPVVHSDLIVPSRWQTFHPKPRHIKLYTMDGFLVDGSSDLIDHHYYVASGLETFKPLPYWETQKVPEDIKIRYTEFKKIMRRNRKMRNTRPSETEPVEEELKEVVDRSLYEEILKNSESSVYHAKTEKKPSYTDPLTLGGAEGDVFQARSPRKEFQGALYVKDDQNVQIELPIDQRPAEEIKDEDIFDITSNHDNKGSKKEWRLKMFGLFFRSKVRGSKSDTSLVVKQRLSKQSHDQILCQESQLIKRSRHPGQQKKKQKKPHQCKEELLHQEHWPWNKKRSQNN
ncbi:doublecortin domain-containing protein 2C isoform X3 [Sarcophilus harrisii]|uniref:doublecortin domain-containing protein 2C isoform X3 n=1 Tax=Sarcophilus harrisii TaxID=9305 RepID=UPI001301FC3D|nr:doublecortin domain-containing protein 2C isoform X3 [Sarcophilus harrisii]